jgi:peptidoglycan/LPS O-acetylase OafA/YrhL
LQIFSIGLLGISIGYLPINRINHFAQRPLAIFVAYLAYLAAITFCDDVYLLQIIGVCLSLALIYWTGIGSAEATRIGKVTVVLGQYSLFAYIAQIVILQILKRTLRPLGGGIGVSGSALLACLACTILSVVILDRGRIRMVGLNRFYSAVFG